MGEPPIIIPLLCLFSGIYLLWNAQDELRRFFHAFFALIAAIFWGLSDLFQEESDDLEEEKQEIDETEYQWILREHDDCPDVRDREIKHFHESYKRKNRF